MAKKKKAAPRKKAARPAKRSVPARRPAVRAKASVPAADGALLGSVERFLYRQAELLDGRRWDDFIELFTSDGIYWMPASPEQTTGDGVPSIFYEDRNLMTVRMKRLRHPHAWSQMTAWGTSHLIGNVAIETDDRRTGELVVRSRFHVMEFRHDATRHFAGSYVHHLRRTSDGFRIKLQRVDAVNAQGPYEYVLQAWL